MGERLCKVAGYRKLGPFNIGRIPGDEIQFPEGVPPRMFEIGEVPDFICEDCFRLVLVVYTRYHIDITTSSNAYSYDPEPVYQVYGDYEIKHDKYIRKTFMLV